MRARRSASSSQLFTERMTLSLAGMPAGKSAWSRVSRLTLRSLGALERLERLVLPTVVPLVRVARVRRRWFGARLRVALVEARDFAERACLDAPTTPCARRRCVPSAVARVTVHAHS